jgi:GNAT superfamily N-acetyltransferase
MQAAMDFCREGGFDEVHLWTFSGLDAARVLYERHGFELVEECQGDQWGRVVTEQKFVCRLNG